MSEADRAGEVVPATDEDEALDSASEWVAEHTRRYVATGGADGGEWQGVPCLVLTTRGRRTGRLRRNALIYVRDGDDYVVVASKGGADQHPLWYTNLIESPLVTVQVGSDVFTAHAATVTPDEKGRLWPAVTGVWPAYDEYQAKTARDIPVVRLRPV
ncbi:MAG TPA: nitroreductase family deazaflavin-dependent oxidoreductase [Acidimicrobiales bacterium]|jgi:deazaflavin-dependent oxidoreductase (nitroreductase family)|nr:nitroreductase family deazaflavin-dependent oxidoreductase [Acidimicrobiales bacterium]